ncbi:MAG: 30S ribosomal protein S21 [Candidatus Handelsmanbacteria bacterium RIFCSPLOWO2_12_FULL_64_10]|uniref:Small ribosomal subunit protein bS21 n=1 Tax=Handelsmanbacteria sp. (strain RIFCSPLOWO2_12_FULL_64_10) TaxID=1817868 RepID=A0A1F6CC90_HANXR|nr:MAG: 30S ribosomal protein S21 [Candidatus Handelsmanbacteria bacterium RIFCSPLOWO2_12_FULL_64_10]
MVGHVGIKVRDAEPIEKVLRRFSTKVKRSGLLAEMKRSRFFMTQGEVRKMKQQRSARRRQKALRHQGRFSKE